MISSVFLDIPFKTMKSIPDTYTQFRKEVESKSKIRKVLDMPNSLKPIPPGLDVKSVPEFLDFNFSQHYKRDTRTAFPFEGGETSGLLRLENYLWGTHSVATYKETRNGLIGTNYSTKLSPWLAIGCISPRMIFSKIKKYEYEL